MLADARMVYLDVYVSDLAVSRAFYEDTLGLRVIEAEPNAIKFDGGHVILVLKPAQDYGVAVPIKPDGSADIVFLVDDLVAMRTALEERGVEFSPTSWYEVGGLADFYDPDWHWLTLYQPSDEAMTWPSAEKIRAVRRVRQGHATEIEVQSRPVDKEDVSDLVLDGREIIYLFVFVEDPQETEVFYHQLLGLRALEGGPCSQTSTGDVDGVVKYDAGGLILSTHLMDETRTQEEVDEHLCPPRELDLERLKSVTATFHVPNIEKAIAELSRRGVHFTNGTVRAQVGTTAAFEDPTGHVYFLYEPSAEALSRPSGAKISQILATPV